MAVSGGIVEVYQADAILSGVVGATAVVAGMVVEYSATGKTIIPAADGSVKVAGVALQSGSVAGDIISYAAGKYFNLIADGAITAGDTLAAADGAGAGGCVRKWVDADTDEAMIGRAVNDIADTVAGLCRIW